MAKEIIGLIKLQVRGGAANPSPPVGPALGAKGFVWINDDIFQFILEILMFFFLSSDIIWFWLVFFFNI